MPETKPLLEMKIDLNVIDHLGLKMYTSLPAVIAEYVANAWDAGATRVDVKVPDGPPKNDYSIAIQDNGFGMLAEEVNRKFLLVGRNRREDGGEEVQSVKGQPRRVMGRKGLGKLAGFGVAEQVLVRTRKDGLYIEFRMDYGEMLKRVKEGGLEFKTSYSPEVVNWGKTGDPNGTLVSLRGLKRKKPVDVEDIKENLARHFSVISETFEVRVNDGAITAADMHLRNKCKHVVEIDESIDTQGSLMVRGWIGISSQALPKEAAGVVIMARGRLVQTPTTFDAGGVATRGVVYLPSLIGQLHAEFLDAGEDMIGTGRRSIIRETEEGQLLWTWGTAKVKEILSDWVDKRAKEKLEEVKRLPVYEERIANLPTFERRVVEGFLVKLAEKEDVETSTVEKVADFLASGAEYKGFLELVDTLERADVARPEVLIEFFRDWEILDAIEMARIVEGRLDVIRKFQEYLDSGAKEVPELHNFLVDNPWLLDPTWDYLQDEVVMADILRQKFPDTSGGRIDFLCLGHGNTLNVVELKRPTVAVGRKELDQIEDYVDHISTLQGNDPRTSYSTFVGYVVGAKLSSAQSVSKKAQRLASSSIYVKTYSDLQRTAYNSNLRFIGVLKRKAARIKDSRLEASLRRLEDGAKVKTKDS